LILNYVSTDGTDIAGKHVNPNKLKTEEGVSTLEYYSKMGLSCLNVINVLAYIANLLISYGVGAIGYGGFKTNAEISETYQTLITPDELTFGIWATIFISQLIFVIAQLFPAYQSSPLVSKAIGYDYLNVCIFQIGWTFAFAFEYILVSLICMVILLYFLVGIVNDQYKVSDLQPTSVVDYWLMKFPFSVHCGWIIAATFVNISVFLVSLNLDATIQYYVALGSLGALALIACFSVAFPTQGDYMIGLTLAWASVSTTSIFIKTRPATHNQIKFVLVGCVPRTWKSQGSNCIIF
jgi:hypothetical protein